MRALLAVLLLAAAAPPARADEPSAPPPGKPAPQLTKAPVLTQFVEAVYPPEEEAAGRTGAVAMVLTLDATGAVTEAVIAESAGEAFDAAALAAARQFVFEPAEIDFVPAPVRLQYRYEFTLKPPPPPAPDPAAPKPGIVAVEGRVLERGTRVPLANVTVAATKDTETVTATTDAEGRFALKDLSPGHWSIAIVESGFDRYVTGEDVVAGEVLTATYYVRRRSEGFEAVVRARREKKEVARRTLVLEEIRKIPGTNGDALRVIQNLPGVARTPLNLGPPVVRGGRVGDTRTYVDGQLVPLLFHFGGLVSVVPSEFIDSVDFYPGDFPVRYGRSMAGAIDVNTKRGSKERYRGIADVSITGASAFVEGPIPGVPGTFQLGVRRSYFELALPIVQRLVSGADQLDFRVAPRFWDYQLKADFDLGADQLGFFLFGSDDVLEATFANPALFTANSVADVSTAIGFHRLTGTWKHRFTDALDHRLAVTLGVDQSSTSLGDALSTNLGLQSAAVRDELSWTLAEALKLQGGADLFLATYRYDILAPPLPAPGEFIDPDALDASVRAFDTGANFQLAGWLDAVWKPLPGLKLVPGLRVDGDTYMRKAWFDPRLTGFYELTNEVALKASAGVFHQPPIPTRLLRSLGNPELGAEGSRQYAAGVEWNPGGLFELDLQVYFKDVFDETYRTGATTLDTSGAPRNLLWANGQERRAYGVELLLRRPPGAGLWGWIALSLGQAETRNPLAPDWTTATLQQRYSLVTVASYRLPLEVDAGVRLRWTDGNPRTPNLGGVYFADSDVILPLPSAATRSDRLPFFFQLDLRVDRKWVFDTWVLDAYLDVQNVTNRCNVEGTQYNYDFTQSKWVCGIPILPTAGVRGEF